jgi:glutamine amidotransferase
LGRVAIIDYRMGNVRSVMNAVEYCGHEPILTADAAAIRDADRIILPGDGAFGDAMEHLRDADLIDLLEREVIAGGKPFLGICVGMQILATTSLEHVDTADPHVGLGWFDAEIVRIEPRDAALKVPHMGWSQIDQVASHPILRGFEAFDPSFYFVHSYRMELRQDANLIGSASHGEQITAIIGRDNIVATQFHPEKSQDNGLELLGNFLSWAP